MLGNKLLQAGNKQKQSRGFKNLFEQMLVWLSSSVLLAQSADFLKKMSQWSAWTIN